MLSRGNIRNLISILVGWVPAMVETVKHVTGSPKNASISSAHSLIGEDDRFTVLSYCMG